MSKLKRCLSEGPPMETLNMQLLEKQLMKDTEKIRERKERMNK